MSKIDLLCARLHDTITGSFFFFEISVTANNYLDMFQIYSLPQMQHLQHIGIFQQDGTPGWMRQECSIIFRHKIP